MNELDTFNKRLDKLESRIDAIETIHFARLKDYLVVLNAALLDSKVIDKKTRTKLDYDAREL